MSFFLLQLGSAASVGSRYFCHHRSSIPFVYSFYSPFLRTICRTQEAVVPIPGGAVSGLFTPSQSGWSAQPRKKEGKWAHFLGRFMAGPDLSHRLQKVDGREWLTVTGSASAPLTWLLVIAPKRSKRFLFYFSGLCYSYRSRSHLSPCPNCFEIVAAFASVFICTLSNRLPFRSAAS